MAKKTSMMEKVGSWAFIIGVIIAVIAGFWPMSTVVTAILVIIGLIVGLLNVTASETKDFLLAAVVLVIVSSFGGSLMGNVHVVLQRMLDAIVIFVVPATVIVALRAIYNVANN